MWNWTFYSGVIRIFLYFILFLSNLNIQVVVLLAWHKELQVLSESRESAFSSKPLENFSRVTATACSRFLFSAWPEDAEVSICLWVSSYAKIQPGLDSPLVVKSSERGLKGKENVRWVTIFFPSLRLHVRWTILQQLSFLDQLHQTLHNKTLSGVYVRQLLWLSTDERWNKWMELWWVLLKYLIWEMKNMQMCCCLTEATDTGRC